MSKMDGRLFSVLLFLTASDADDDVTSLTDLSVCPAGVPRTGLSPFPPEVDHLCLVDIQEEVKVLTPILSCFSFSRRGWMVLKGTGEIKEHDFHSASNTVQLAAAGRTQHHPHRHEDPLWTQLG